jgi:hypothetical protein
MRVGIRKRGTVYDLMVPSERHFEIGKRAMKAQSICPKYVVAKL